MAGWRRAPRGAGPLEERDERAVNPGGPWDATVSTTEPPRSAGSGWAELEARAEREDGAGEPRDRRGPVLLEVEVPASGSPTPANPLLLRFDEAVRAGPGTIRLVGEEGTIRIAARDGERVRIEDDTVRIGLDRTLEPGSTYTLEVGRKALRDLAGNPLQPIRSELLPVIEVAPPDDPGPAPAPWTILVYMAADNDLERYALLDLAEMERVALPSSVNLVALVDRSPWYVAGPNDFTDTRVGPVRPDGDPRVVGTELVSIGERNTADPATLTGFLDWAQANFPAERYGLVIWDHGGGLEGAAWDYSSRGDRLTLAEMREGIEASRIGRLDLVGFDACLMAMAEVAAELSGVAEVMVASQELEPAEGWAYDRILAELARRPEATPVELGSAIVESYAAEFAGKRDITLSALDLSALPSLERALDAFARTVGLAADRSELEAVAAAVEATRPFPRDGSYPYRDLGDFLGEVVDRVDDPAIDDAARRALAALDTVVIGERGTVAEASGLAVHLPGAGDVAWPGYDRASFAFLARTDWDGLVDRLVAVG